MTHRFLRRLRPRRLLAATLLASSVVLLAATVLPNPTQAQLTRCGTEYWFWSDDSYTEVVGVRGWLPTECGCQYFAWGILTHNRTLELSYC